MYKYTIIPPSKICIFIVNQFIEHSYTPQRYPYYDAVVGLVWPWDLCWQ